MKPQAISIESRSFFKFRFLLSTMLDQAIEKMMATNTEEGSVTGKIKIRIKQDTDEETGEVIIKPSFAFESDMSVPVKAAGKLDPEGDLLLIRDKDGRLAICDNQISMDEL